MGMKIEGFGTVVSGFDRASDEFRTGLERAMDRIAALLETAAKTESQRPLTGHGFTDHTGNLRNSIRGFADVVTDAGGKVFLTAAMAYAAMVELVSGGEYAYLLPAIEAHKADILAILEEDLAL